MREIDSRFLASRDERERLGKSRPRVAMTVLLFVLAFGLIGVRLVMLGFAPPGLESDRRQQLSTAVRRPDIVDRNGRLLATDIRAASLYADPARVVALDDTVEQLASVIPGLDPVSLRKRLKAGGRFVWVQREMTPAQQEIVHELGLPGLAFIAEPHRVYPAGATASHVLGFVDIDNRGLAGIEKYIDKALPALDPASAPREDQAPVQLSLDMGVQHALRSELMDAITRYQAQAAGGIVLDVHSGEVVALASLPDFDPNRRDQALEPGRYNRMTAGVFELGSVFKVFTVAAGLDYGVVSLDGGYDASQPLQVASHSIDDFHAKRRWLSVPEIFIYSSNIGSAKMALDLGIDRHKAFIRRLGLLDPIQTEIGETASPIAPDRWQQINSMTIAFGHGLSVAPINLAAAAAALFNGGRKIAPTFLRRSREETRVRAEPVLSGRTSDLMRHLMRLNVERGSGSQAEAVGYRVGGKTGTAEKVVDGRYSSNRLLTSFLAVFPAESPRYLVYVLLDEPARVPESGNLATAGVNAAPVTRRLIERVAPMLGVMPRLERQPAFDEYINASY